MKNLFICLTPLQALIAQALIRQTAQPADLLMVCYPEADNAKFQHYYQQTAAQCRRSRYHTVPRRPWQRAFALPRLLDGLDSRYHTLYAASIDNANVQYPASRLTFDRLETFDDGTGNLYPQSLLYQNDSPKRRLLNALRGGLQAVPGSTRKGKKGAKASPKALPAPVNHTRPGKAAG